MPSNNAGVHHLHGSRQLLFRRNLDHGPLAHGRGHSVVVGAFNEHGGQANLEAHGDWPRAVALWLAVAFLGEFLHYHAFWLSVLGADSLVAGPLSPYSASSSTRAVAATLVGPVLLCVLFCLLSFITGKEHNS